VSKSRWGPVEFIASGNEDGVYPEDIDILEDFQENAEARFMSARQQIRGGLFYRPIRVLINNEKRVGVQFQSRLWPRQRCMILESEESRHQLPDEFSQLLQSIPWFAHIGEPIENTALPHMQAWEDWGNPQDSKIAIIHLRQQDLYDAILQDHAPQSTELAAAFDQVVKMVCKLVIKIVPYNKQEDSYYAPNTACYHAGWTAGLVYLCQLTDRELPSDIASQWRWFREGRWPAAFTGVDDDDEPANLVEFRIY
jgi:hypothetical protein